MLYRKIGERFTCNTNTLEVVCQEGCTDCFCKDDSEPFGCKIEDKIICGACGTFRGDKTSVIFKKVEP